MNQYFKIIKDNTVIDVSDGRFLRWQERHRVSLYCDANHGEYMQSSIDVEKIYHAPWMNAVRDSADVQYELAEIAEIEEDEYNNLKSIIEEGMEIEVEPEPVVVEETAEDPIIEEPEPKKPLTLNEMREIIEQQRQEIERLKACIVEMSEVVYDE